MRRRPTLAEVYRILRRSHGPRGWWPTTPAGGDRPAYRPGHEGRRLSLRERIEVAVGAVLTQNTSWTGAARSLENLRRAGLLGDDGRRLGRAPVARIAALIRPSGYFRLKARRLRNLLDAAAAAGGWRGFLARARSTGRLRAALLGVSGVGPETADSILLYAAGRRVFVVDAYTRRVLERHGYIRPGAAYEEIRALFERSLPRSAPLYNDFHAQFVEVGKRFCRPRDPRCDACPLRGIPFARGARLTRRGRGR